MNLEAQLRNMAGLFSECHRCNRAITEALAAGQAPEALSGLFQEKEALLGRLEAITPLPGRAAVADESLREALDQLAQTQADAIRSEAQLSAALLPHIPYHGKRMNPYQQGGLELPKNGLERNG